MSLFHSMQWNRHSIEAVAPSLFQNLPPSSRAAVGPKSLRTFLSLPFPCSCRRRFSRCPDLHHSLPYLPRYKEPESSSRAPVSPRIHRYQSSRPQRRALEANMYETCRLLPDLPPRDRTSRD